MAIAAALSFAGCNSHNTKELTRDRAAALIVQSGALQPQTQVAVSDAAYQLAQGDAVYKFRIIIGPASMDPQSFLSPEGRKYFSAYWWTAHLATVKRPIRLRLVEVSGITDAPPGEGELAEFKWAYADAAEFVIRYTGTTGPDETYYGCANFRLFDDGWRETGLKWGQKCAG